MMKNPKFCIGKTLDDLATRTGHIRGGVEVYLLAGPDDAEGWPIDNGNFIRDIVREHPDLRQCTVKYAQDYYGVCILRVIQPQRARR